jgi:hypothetical protein
MNDTERAMRRLVEVVAELSAEGFVITGEIVAIKPQTPGLVMPVGDLHLGDLTRLVLRTEKVIPPELPNLSSQITIPLEGFTPLNFSVPDEFFVSDEVRKAIEAQNKKDLHDIVKEVDDRITQQYTASVASNPQQFGYTGNACLCGSMRMVRRGSCEYCEDCGASSGCS